MRGAVLWKAWQRMEQSNDFKKITACLDMAGCPNRCRHCWLGCTPNGRMAADDLRFVAEAFRPFTKSLEVASWYREPDYLPEYKELWALENELSDMREVPHWELMSVWRAARDESYIPWLKELGVKACQLTLFGGRQQTDAYTGRKGAYDEIIQAIEGLLAAEIAPRVQAFVNKDNVDDLWAVVDLILNLRLDERCAAFGARFGTFVHQGSCDGENAKLYDVRVTPDDLPRIPPPLAAYSLRHWGKDTLEEIFGETESALCRRLADSTKTHCYVSDTPVFFVDKNFDVYPNITAPEPHWRLGNVKRDGAESILACYLNSESPAQKLRMTVSIGEIVRRCGNPGSQRLFIESDYIDPLIKRWGEVTPCRI